MNKSHQGEITSAVSPSGLNLTPKFARVVHIELARSSELLSKNVLLQTNNFPALVL
jgi:hypothetical protein